MIASEKVDGQPTILIVEDDDWLRVVVADILESSGYRVATANNGKQANDYLATAGEPPAAILMDLMMPIQNGWDFLLGLKGEARFAATPIVVMTGLGRDLPAGVDLVLKKPFCLDDLVETIAHFAQVNRRIDEPNLR